MKQYDPLKAPNPKEWLALDEQERIHLVKTYHRRAGIRLPDGELHAVVHVTIENQIALGDKMPVERKLHSLMAEGLNRHDAIHAIGTALTDFLFDVSRDTAPDANPNRDYLANVERVTVQSWLGLTGRPADVDDSSTEQESIDEIDTSRILDELSLPEGRPETAIRAASSRPVVNPHKGVGRNDPCPCGSGKKFKKCCLN